MYHEKIFQMFLASAKTFIRNHDAFYVRTLFDSSVSVSLGENSSTINKMHIEDGAMSHHIKLDASYFSIRMSHTYVRFNVKHQNEMDVLSLQ